MKRILQAVVIMVVLVLVGVTAVGVVFFDEIQTLSKSTSLGEAIGQGDEARALLLAFGMAQGLERAEKRWGLEKGSLCKAWVDGFCEELPHLLRIVRELDQEHAQQIEWLARECVGLIHPPSKEVLYRLSAI
jgi:hypothetical protein